jgi:hypothetical protein
MMCKTTIPADVLILTNRTVIDGTGADPIFGGTVVFHKDRILSVGPASGSDVSPTHASSMLEAEQSCRD